MKYRLNVLNSKEIKEIRKKLEEQFGYTEPLDYAFTVNNRDRISVVNRDIDMVNIDALRINSAGLYFCEDHQDGLRLSIEGSQMIGPYAKKNVISLDRSAAREWLKGFDVEYPGESKGFVIVKCENDYMGSAKHKNGKLINHVPKERRIHATD